MKPLSIKLLLLLTFTFWASGFAKFIHESTEHHGRDAAFVDEDGDDLAGLILAASTPLSPDKPVKAPCPVCQMLAGMAVCHPTPTCVPAGVGELVGVVALPICADPTVCICFCESARDPPFISLPV